MKASQKQHTPDAVFIDDAAAAALDTARWTRLLRAAGVRAHALRWPRSGTRMRGRRVSERDFTLFRDTALDLGRPVAVGRGSGAAITYRLLSAGAVRAGVLIAPRGLLPTAIGTHSPMLFLHDSTPELQLNALREDGICDQKIRDARPSTAIPGAGDANVAQYIRDWLDFHRLLTQ